MLPIYKVPSLSENIFSTILALENLSTEKLAVLTLGAISYITANGFVKAVIQTEHIDERIVCTHLSKKLSPYIKDAA